MAISDQVQAPGSPADKAATAWYALSGDEVTARLGVDPTTGLAAARAAELLAKNGPNALPVEKPPSTIRRLLAEYTSYMQIILVGAAIVSLVIQQWATAIVLFVITLLNAVVGLRQAGKAESAMNALQSMMKATARVRRDGTEAEIPAEQLVVGDVVLIAAGDEVPADGRIVTSSALQIDESALTGESVPAPKERRDAVRRRARTRRAVEHGVHAHARHARQRGDGRDGDGERHPGRQDRGHALGDGEGGDAAHQADEHADAVDRRRGGADDGRDVRARPGPRARRGRCCSTRRWRSRSRRSRSPCRWSSRSSSRSAASSSPRRRRSSRTCRRSRRSGSPRRSTRTRPGR